MWYLYATIGLAAICLGIPIFLIYWTDKKKKIAYDKNQQRILIAEDFGYVGQSLINIAKNMKTVENIVIFFIKRIGRDQKNGELMSPKLTTAK